MITNKIIIRVFIILFLFTVAWLVFRAEPTFKTSEGVAQPISQGSEQGDCLGDRKFAEYPKRSNDIAEITVPLNAPTTTVSVYNKDTSLKINEFEIYDISTDGHSVELHNCGVYVVKEIGFDYVKSKTLDNFSVDLWSYNYKGESKKIISFAGKDSQKKEYTDYSYDFRVDPSEKYLSLIKGYGGSSDYSLIIKDLKTLKDVLVLPVADIAKLNPDVVGDIGFENAGWSSDGKYFWFHLDQGADIAGFVRVDVNDWSYKVFPAPLRTMGGDAFNVNTGMVTYGADVAPWSGMVEIDQQYRDEAKQSGQISSFYIYDLLTSKKYLIATSTDPTYYFRPQWISNTELQYVLPSGEKKIHKLD